MMIILTLILHISFPDEHSSSPREEPLQMRGPRTFAGQKEAPVIEFAMSFAESIGNSEETRDKCELVCGYLKDGMPNNGSPGVADLGGLAKLKRVAFARILEHAGAEMRPRQRHKPGPNAESAEPQIHRPNAESAEP